MIKIKNVNKYYNKNKNNEVHVINNANLEINEPGFVTFLGPSGAGKSTLLHVIGGLDKASGDVIYEDINFLKANRNKVDSYRNQHIGYIFQSYNLLPNLTVYENLAVQLELLNVYDKEIIDKKINECLKIVGLDKYKRRKVTALSGGQQQRVAIARALVKGAKIIIADEPTGNLDTKNSIEVMNILKILSKKYYVILVTHNVSLANHYSDRIIKIKDGKIIEDIDNQNKNTLLHADSNAIYLKEYDKKEFNEGLKNVLVYDKENSKLNLNIIIDKDAIYIENDNNLPIKVINENTDKYILDEELEEESINEDVLLSLDYTPGSNYKLRSHLKNFFIQIKNSVYKIFNSSIKKKILYIAFFGIGIILSLCLNALSISTTISNDLLVDTPKNAVVIDLSKSSITSKYGFSLEPKELIQILEEDKSITGIVDPVEDVYFNFKVISNRTTKIKIGNKCFVTTPKSYNKYDLKLADNEIAISNNIADEIIAYTSSYNLKTYEDLLGYEIYVYIPKIYQGNVIIKEIVDTYDQTILVSDFIYYAKYKDSLNKPAYNLNYIWDENYEYFRSYNPITVPAGDVYSIDSKLPKALISENLLDYFIGIDYFMSTPDYDVWTTYSDSFGLIGSVPEEGFNIIFRTEADYNKFVELNVTSAQSYLPYQNYEIDLTEGSALPVNDNEILLPDTIDMRRDYPIGSTFVYKYDYSTSINLTVTGYFKLDYPTNITHLYTNENTAYLISSLSVFERFNDDDATFYFYTSDQDKTIEYFNLCGYDANNAEKLVLQQGILAKVDLSKVIIVISICIIIAMILFMFFINRSKLLQDIYEIGVYRALGVKKRYIYKDFILESILVTTITIVLGFTLSYFFTLNANEFVPGIAVDIKYYFYSLILIYIVMVISSILPAILLLRKTPIEIINKYDI